MRSNFLLSAWPEVRGTADTDGGAYSPFRSILLVLTHDYIIIQIYGPTGGDGQNGLNRLGRWECAPFQTPFETKGVLYAWGHVQPANGSPTRTTSG